MAQKNAAVGRRNPHARSLSRGCATEKSQAAKQCQP